MSTNLIDTVMDHDYKLNAGDAVGSTPRAPLVEQAAASTRGVPHTSTVDAGSAATANIEELLRDAHANADAHRILIKKRLALSTHKNNVRQFVHDVRRVDDMTLSEILALIKTVPCDSLEALISAAQA